MICMGLLLLWLLFTTLANWRHDFVLIHPQKIESKNVLVGDELNKLIENIPSDHIFGQSGTGAHLPVTSLQIRLVGVIKAVPESFSRVIISEGGKPGKVYKVGDRLSSGVIINAITSDGVILDNGGRLEKLPLQRPPLLFQGKPKPLLQEENGREEE